MLNIHVNSLNIFDKYVLKDIGISFKPHSTTLISGNNGEGKTTLVRYIVGYPDIKGDIEVTMNDEEISKLPMHSRIRKGIYISSQNPVPISGIKTISFLRTQYMMMEYITEKTDLVSFRFKAKELASVLGLDPEILERDINVGFSGGEMKRLEVLQLLLLKPRYAILDEIDSGIDSNSLKTIYGEIRRLVSNGLGLILISHNKNIREYIGIDKEYVLERGSINEKKV